MENEKGDLKSLAQIKELVDLFYGKVRMDPLIGPIFEGKLKGNWDKHLEKMYQFWQTVLLSQHTYYGSPFPPHANLPIDQNHFERWLMLFQETLRENFFGDKANEAMWRASKMAEMFQLKIAYYQNKNISPLG
ncbi:group III truncated hemoglobin [uncultured Cyclobacterium sp.]|uniref:group III truncated hemoglobin n=1 Tax=uncultured Cyclobacterium sp. TaxID=453820 RepID=UPI0030ED2FFB